jgi:DNA-binding IclR family transcriptional regulator
MAFQPEDMLAKAFAHQPLVRYTANTCIELRQLKRQYAQVRSQGYALCIDELDPGVMSVATPVRMEAVGVFYSVGLVGLQPRLSKFPTDRLVTGLKAAAESIAKLVRSRRTEPMHEADPNRLGELQ